MYSGFVVYLLFISSIVAHAAYSPHIVKNLPGQPHVEFKQYAGYINIHAKSERSLFYWFVEASHANASSLPILLWLNGGPGCSSVGLGGLSEKIGPFLLQKQGKGISLNKNSWNQYANLLFLESPYGVGFSYTEAKKDLEYYSIDQAAEDNLQFLIEWFTKFPEFRKSDLYLSGESFAGQYAPTLGTRILAYNMKESDQINFKGFLLGNAYTSKYYEDGSVVEFLYSHSVISQQAYEDERDSCYVTRPINMTRCNKAMDNVDELIQHIDSYNIYAYACTPSEKERKDGPCADKVTPYMNMPEVQAALNVKTPVSWSHCNDNIFKKFHEKDPSGRRMLVLYKDLFEANLKIWIYSGDLDSMVPTIATRRWIDALKLRVEKPWYTWRYKSQAGGWAQVYSGLTFATVRGAGHSVPEDKPEEALLLFKCFLHGKPLPSFGYDQT